MPAPTCQCYASGCAKDARWQVAFRVWPIGDRSRRGCVAGMSGCCVCDEHAPRDADKFFTAKAKEQIEITFLRGGRGMPDFTTAQIVLAEIVDGEPLTMHEAASLGNLPEMLQ